MSGRVFILLWSSLWFSCTSHKFSAEKQELNKAETITILFLGNSLTYSNDLPDLVAKMGSEQKKKIKTLQMAYPNYALEDHWNEGKLQETITQESIDYLVIQQGPSSQADGRTSLLDYGARIKTLCDKHQTKLAFFMVWPSIQNWSTFDGVIKNYDQAAKANTAIICPVGKEWKMYIESTKDYSYYGPDGFHPSLEGSKFAARIIYESLFE